MKSFRFVCSFAVLMLAALVIAVVVAQSNPVAHAKAIPRAQTLPAGAAAQLAPISQTPKVRYFAKAVTYSAGTGASSVAVMDVNGDGKPDIVVADGEGEGNGDGVVGVLLGNGDGTFQAARSYDSGGLTAVSVAVSDVNGDGKPDLIVANRFQCTSCENGGVTVLLGNGDGSFQSAVSYSSGGEIEGTSVAVGDVNGDGKPDIVTTNLFGGVGVLLGNGDGTFQSPISYNSGEGYAFSVAIGDVNGDGKNDLVVANWCGGGNCSVGGDGGVVGVLLGDGNGGFESPVIYSSGGYYANSVVIGDVNGDGKPDLVVANECVRVNKHGGCEGNGTVSMLVGNGDGTFQTPVSYLSGGSLATSVAFEDLNGDGLADIVVTNSRGQSVGVLLGNGDGTFQAPVTCGTGGDEPGSLAAVDVNGDGKSDLVVANFCLNKTCNAASTVGVLLNIFAMATTTAVTSSPNPSMVNQSATFTATVTSTGSIPNGQTVAFYNGTAEIGAGTTTNGVASLTTSFAKAKTYTIKADYPGDAFHKKSSGTVKQVVNP